MVLISFGNDKAQINISDRRGTIIDPKIDILYDRLREREKNRHREKEMIMIHEDLL